MRLCKLTPQEVANISVSNTAVASGMSSSDLSSSTTVSSFKDLDRDEILKFILN